MATPTTHDASQDEGAAGGSRKPKLGQNEPGPAKGSPEERDSFSVLKEIAEASSVFIAIAFVGGWSYLAAYYRTFGIGVLELDIPIQVVSTMAIRLLYDGSMAPLLVVVAMFALFMWASHRFAIGVCAALLGVLLLGAAGAGGLHGRRIAASDMTAESTSLPFVAFNAKFQQPEPSCVDFGTYGSMDCKLLLHLKDTYYFFLPVPQAAGGNVNLYTISESDLTGVHIQRGIEGGQ